MSCLNNIISVKNFCNPGLAPQSLSGYDLMDAPELDVEAISSMANEKFVKGYDLAVDAVRQATNEIQNDFLGVLASNKIGANLIAKTYATSDYDSKVIFPAISEERGFTLYQAGRVKSNIRKLTITKIFLNAAEPSESVQIKIYDNGRLTTFSVSVNEGLNEYEVDYTLSGRSARIVLAADSIPVYSTKLTCFSGCNGTTPNDCGYTKAWNGAEVSIKEGYGLGAEFKCECDFTSLLCDLSKVYISRLVYLKSRIKLLETRIYSSRLNAFIVYGADEAKEHKDELMQEYNEEWQTFATSLPNILSEYHDACLNCNGITWKTNI